MTENQSNPQEDLPRKEPEPVPQTDSSQASDYFAPATGSLTNQPQQDMEVHHHGHVHERKKWKEYVFQFIMLLLAIILGFQSENFRENLVEKNMETEYMESLRADAAIDYDLASRNSNAIFEQVKKIDTLQDLLFSVLENAPGNDSVVKKCYQMTTHISTFYSEFFSERTIIQLLSSGNMRVVKKDSVAERIMDYHSFIKFVEDQKHLYINSINAGVQAMYTIYDITFLKTVMVEDKFRYWDPYTMPTKFLTTNPAELKKFIAILETTKIVAATYKDLLVEMMQRSENLISFLTAKYPLKKKEIAE